MKNNPKFVVYTAIFRGYDALTPIDPLWCKDCDFICFTDTEYLQHNGWTIINICNNQDTGQALNRKYKFLPHLFLNQYQASLYMDGNIELKNNPKQIFEKYKNSLIAIPKHYKRSCAYQEAKDCLSLGLINEIGYNRIISKFEKDNFPINFGLTENNIIFRQHNNIGVIRLMDEWWQLYCEFQCRDQLLLPYIFWKTNFQVDYLLESPRYSEKNFSYKLHEKDKKISYLKRYIRLASFKTKVSFYYFLITEIVVFIDNVRNKLKRLWV